MTTVLAVDPGINYPAAAIFRDGRLVIASRVKLPGRLKKLPMGERVREVSLLIEQWVSSQNVAREDVDHVIFECPQIYRASKSKGDPNDLIPLAMVGGYVAGLYSHASVTSPLPREWIGQLPKSTKGDPWCSPRGELVARRLDAAERACVIPSHDAIDAVGIGLHHHNRLIVRVLPGTV